ncbi:gliding motility-associated C-terminal domain-containing protein [uncultured Maribacter sp.]|uniref:T9SS type B sorting domain-containing protein n=1 Tax=uncultured Maribacter sp. TaxID=431308 RepID=UPI00261EC5B9|nr:gliding motility-associated C-terminal domain-containing protein [uncultured Maribacter sp.]
MRKIFKNTLAWVCLVFTTVSFAQTVDMTVQQGPNIDVMVTVGSAQLDLAPFETDLETSLINKGMPLGKLRVEAFERSTISSDQADAADIFNSWVKMDFTGAEPPNPHNSLAGGVYSGPYFSFDSGTNRILADPVARNSGNYGVAMYDPTGDVSDGSISATFGLSGDPYVHAEVGFIFRKVDNDNFYAYIIDNHTYCGNLQGYASGDGFPAEAILKRENGVTTILAVNTSSGQSGTATYGWNGNRADMFGAFYNGQAIDFRIEMSGNDIKIYRKGGGGNAGTDWIESFDITDSTHSTGSYGFYVHEQENAYFEDIAIEKLSLRAFKDVLREPQWRNNALRFNINLDDLEVADFNDDSDLSEILMRTINEDIHYIGWGVNANKTQFERFVTQNNQKGTFVNRDETAYNDWIDQIAQYIYNQYVFGTVSAGEYFIAGTSVEIDVTPTELKTNTANASYPNGRWKITHDETFFDNNSGKVSWHDLYLEDVPEFYEKTGEYSFTFEDLPTAPTTLYFHRKPVASFTYNPGAGTLTDNSYDLDGGANNGIANSEWKWKSVDASATNDWTIGQFNPSGQPDGQYLIMLTVQDHQGTYSSPASVYVEKTSATPTNDDLPLAQFNILPDVLTTYAGTMTIAVENNSADPYGRTLTAEEWIVTQRTYDNEGNPTDVEIYNSTTPMTDFSAYNSESADYIISLRTQTDTGVWSLPFYRTLNIIHDASNPTITASPANGNVTTEDNITLTFSDEGLGSGFDVQRYALTQSATPPATDDANWSSWSNSQSKDVSFSTGGSGWYIHAEAKDNATNTAATSFGPYNLTLVVAANDDLLVVDEDSDGTPVDVLYNDVYESGNDATLSIITQGLKGYAEVDGDNTRIFYYPDENENGTDSITYQLDDNGTLVTATITVSITPVDDQPIGNENTFDVNENATLNDDVSTNDEEVDGDPVTYHIISNPSNASSFTFNSDGTFTYVHDGEEEEQDSFTYNFQDGNSFSEDVTVNINVSLQNDTPTGGDISIDVVQDVDFTFTPSNFTFNDDDLVDEFNGIQIITLPPSGKGELTYEGNPVSENDFIDDVTLLLYITEAGEFGTDYTSFTFKVKDLEDAVSTATYTTSIDAEEDTDGDGDGNSTDPDDDGDGTPDTDDAFPLDNTEDTDTDNDGTGDNADDDDDDDGTPDEDDAFPLDDTEDTDTDNDGTGDNADTDDDNDGTPDVDDAFPLDANEDTDTDNDGTGDNADTDDDGDGTPDEEDDFPLDANEDTDTDNDGTGDNADTDDDDDGTPDVDDAFPLDANEDTDTDNDGTGDNADTDDDGDGTPDEEDDFPLDANEDTDTDNDGTGDNADTDDDNDGTPDSEDDFPLDANEDTDTDNDGTGDNADTDDDGDGTSDVEDDFPLDANEDTDSDNDGTGDNADTDDDNDGTSDVDDDFPLDPTEDTDTDNDGTGDNADDDDDNDGTLDSEDDFPLDPTEDTDTDNDGIGDYADTDDDGDGNIDTDTDGDGLGNNIDLDDDNDGTLDFEDAFSTDPAEDTDTDGDGTGDNADLDDDNDGYSDQVEHREGTDSKNFASTPEDTDLDGISDSVDTDDDNDGVVDTEDVFPKIAEPTLAPSEAFTPNGDGINDSWVIPGIDNYPNSNVKVYNRWGHEVFATESYKNDWNGKYKSNSEKLPAGSYLYVIDLGNGTAPLRGWMFINY